MPSATSKFGPEVQRVPVDAPVEDVIALLKRDGGVIIKNFVSHESIDQCYKEIKPKMDADREWQGKFFPSTLTCDSLDRSGFSPDDRRNETLPRLDRGLPNVYSYSTESPSLSSRLQPLPHHPKLLLVG